MLIGYPPPGVVPTVWTGTPTNLAAMADGRPGSVTRMVATQGETVVRCRVSWPTPAPIRIVAALGLSCPVGTELLLTGRRLTDTGHDFQLGGNSATQKVVELVDGSRAAWFVLPESNPPLIAIQLRVSSLAFDIGELVAHQAVDVPIQPNWETARIDPSVLERTLGGDVNVVKRRTYRRLRAAPQTEALAAVRQGGIQGVTDWERLAFAAAGGSRLSVVPRWGSPGLDADELHRTALYGIATPGGYSHVAGNYFQSAVWSFDELPPI